MSEHHDAGDEHYAHEHLGDGEETPPYEGPNQPQSSDSGAQEAHGEGDRMDWIEEPQDPGSEHCGPTSVSELLTWFSGDPSHPFTEDKLVSDAQQAGLLSPTGMSIPGVAELLNEEGLPSHLDDASTEAQAGENPLVALDQYLDEGRGVILAVDSKEIWYGEQDTPGQPDQDPDHALIVSQIVTDPSDPHGGYAILQDSGQPGSGGVGERVPLDTLMNAWSDSNYSMIVTDESPPWYSSEQQAIFDPATQPADQQPTDQQPAPDSTAPQPAPTDQLTPEQITPDQTQEPTSDQLTPTPAETPVQIPTGGGQSPIQVPLTGAGLPGEGHATLRHAVENAAVFAPAGLLVLLPVKNAGQRLLEKRRLG